MLNSIDKLFNRKDTRRLNQDKASNALKPTKKLTRKEKNILDKISVSNDHITLGQYARSTTEIYKNKAISKLLSDIIPTFDQNNPSSVGSLRTCMASDLPEEVKKAAEKQLNTVVIPSMTKVLLRPSPNDPNILERHIPTYEEHIYYTERNSDERGYSFAASPTSYHGEKILIKLYDNENNVFSTNTREASAKRIMEYLPSVPQEEYDNHQEFQTVVSKIQEIHTDTLNAKEAYFQNITSDISKEKLEENMSGLYAPKINEIIEYSQKAINELGLPHKKVYEQKLDKQHFNEIKSSMYASVAAIGLFGKEANNGRPAINSDTASVIGSFLGATEATAMIKTNKSVLKLANKKYKELQDKTNL